MSATSNSNAKDIVKQVARMLRRQYRMPGTTIRSRDSARGIFCYKSLVNQGSLPHSKVGNEILKALQCCSVQCFLYSLMMAAHSTTNHAAAPELQKKCKSKCLKSPFF